MTPEFQAAYKQLNNAQRQAVDAIEGPVLVVAGPGTGKTQLLSMRAANILRLTDTAPNNILCLTFTDNAARNMRERLESIIGQSAFHVAIYTFHSFGSDIINRYPDYFLKRQLLQQVDELGRYELLREIFDQLPHSNPLSIKVGDDFIFLKDTLNAISWFKQNALSPLELHKIIKNNNLFFESLKSALADTFAITPSTKFLASYTHLLNKMSKQKSGLYYFGFPDYATECTADLAKALKNTDAKGRYAPAITAWRNAWCQKDAAGHHIFKDSGRNSRKIQAVANVYQKLLDSMSAKGLYDFDDMIMETVHAMESNDDLKLNLQERFQYVLVDEFQDTNKAQLRMMTSLGDNPINQERPNIMAVGDDDQAIFSFQGAEASNMGIFVRQYKNPILITLNENYRSTDQILDAGFSVAEQISDRFEAFIPDNHKALEAKASYKFHNLQKLDFHSELAQYGWIAEQVSILLNEGIRPESVSIIAPRHRYLERLMPYLGNLSIPIAYERRENILDAPIIVQLLSMAELVVAIAENRQDAVDGLISKVLSFDFWEISAQDLIDVSLHCYNNNLHWLAVLPKYKNIKLKSIVAWFLELAKQGTLEPLEYILDQFMGTVPGSALNELEHIEIKIAPKPNKSSFVSPMRYYYFNLKRYDNSTAEYLTLLGQLSSLRQHLRAWKPNQMLYINDLAEFASLHHAAKIKIIDSNPHTQTTNAVQVMTAYKAKGLEFDAVFVINAQDEIWGPTSRTRSPGITMPKNLPIEPASDRDNDKLRLLFVAMTRAKHSLYITGYTHDLSNKLSPGLSFLNTLKFKQAIKETRFIEKPASAQAIEILSTDWAYRFRQIIADKPTLFEPILERYKLNVTHLNNFVDVTQNGPEYFLMHNLLRFPEAPTPSAAYGDAVHKTLQWGHVNLLASGKLPSIAKMQAFFVDSLDRKHLKLTENKRLKRRGQDAIKLYIEQRGYLFKSQDIVEQSFENEGAKIGSAHITGKIDKISLNSIVGASVIDFKTGKPALSWQGKDDYEKLKLHKYRQQLLFYKILIENSATYRGNSTVSMGKLDFVEASERGQLEPNLQLNFVSSEILTFIRLVESVWSHITQLNFPDVSKYPKNTRGLLQFEQDLIDGKV
ncbi:MAG TPA: ATP-dependent DNA helicase [Candidatus Saccharimonadales bacterium]|nr:ATP-dependent DNA helicase [Candidatus Saccharimonadales bacterium]